jgi:hypothetical protein
MNRLITGAVSLFIALLTIVSAAPSAFADGPYDGIDCKAAKESTLCTSKTNSTNNPLTGPNGVLRRVTTVLATISGIAAVLIIMIGGFMYVTAGGNASKVEEAKKAILYAAIGLVVIVVAQSLILFVLGTIKV